MRTFVALSALVGAASAQCLAADYQDWITGFYQGMQFDTTDVTTSCYSATEDLNASLYAMVISFYTGSVCTDSDSDGTFYCNNDTILCELNSDGTAGNAADYTCSSDWTYTDWIDPVYKFNTVLVNLAIHNSKCNMNLFAKQFNTRVSTWSGFFDLLMTYGWAFMDGMVLNVTNNLYTELMTINFNTDSCTDLGLSMGTIWSQTLTAYTADEFYVEQVQYSVS